MQTIAFGGRKKMQEPEKEENHNLNLMEKNARAFVRGAVDLIGENFEWS